MLSCSHGQDCEVDKQGIANCVCSQTCEPIVRPVCANNGNTFDNLCEMELNGCQDRLPLVAKYFGTCGMCILYVFFNKSREYSQRVEREEIGFENSVAPWEHKLQSLNS